MFAYVLYRQYRQSIRPGYCEVSVALRRGKCDKYPSCTAHSRVEIAELPKTASTNSMKLRSENKNRVVLVLGSKDDKIMFQSRAVIALVEVNMTLLEASLVSISEPCNMGCTATYTDNECTILYQNNTSTKEITVRLWNITLPS